MSKAENSELPQGFQLTPMDEHFRYHMHEVLDKLRETAPVHKDNQLQRWVVTKYNTCRDIYKNKDMFGRDWEKLAGQGTFGKMFAPLVGKWGMVDADGVEHRRLRGLVSKAFAPKAIDALKPKIERITDELIAAVADSAAFDFIEKVSAPLPTLVMAEMLGVPKVEQTTYRRWSLELIQILNPSLPEETMQQALAAKEALRSYFAEMARQRRETPRDDLITRLVQAREGDETLTEEELVTACVVLIVGGNVTTTDVLGNGLVALLQNPEQMEKLRARPELMDKAVEEILRYDGPGTDIPRYCAQATELDGVKIANGDSLMLSIAGANHDPEVYQCPHKFDIERDGPPHQAFGGGVHYCLGAQLARLEMKIVLGKLLAAFPVLRLAEQTLERRAIAMGNAYKRVIVEIGR